MERETRKTLDFVMAIIRTIGAIASALVNIFVYFHYVRHH
jgi:hypothetical protein